jgi:hypothetical protein
MSNRKPILVVNIPEVFCFEHGSLIQKNLDQRLSDDYYVIVTNSNKGDDIDFKVLNNTDIDDTNYEELKKLILGEVIYERETP